MTHQIKHIERTAIEKQTAEFLARGGAVTPVERGATARTIAAVGAELRAVLNPPKRTRAQAQAELAKRHFKAGSDARRKNVDPKTKTTRKQRLPGE